MTILALVLFKEGVKFTKNKLDLPEVILLDGGKGQLNTVKKSLMKSF